MYTVTNPPVKRTWSCDLKIFVNWKKISKNNDHEHSIKINFSNLIVLHREKVNSLRKYRGKSKQSYLK